MTEPTKPNENEEQRSAPEQTPPMQPIVDMGAVTTRTARGTVYCLTVVGQIEGHSLLPNTVKATRYEHVLPLLAALDESEEIDGVLFLLNTCGGDVEAGLAIAELIAGMRKPTVSLVLGGGHSIGVPLAVAPKRSLIAPSASMTVHPIRTNGTLIAAPQTYHYFDRLQERIETFGAGNIPGDGGALLPIIEKAFHNGTVLTVCSQCPQGAVALGAYETSNALKRAGAVSGLDMTTEAAVAKLYYLFSCGYEKERVKTLMEQDLRGEMTAP